MWRGANGPTDRVFASLVYLLPLATALGYGESLIEQFAFLQPLALVIAPFTVFTDNPFGSILVFILLIAFVINNPKVSHFIRYNVMQAFLLMVIVWLLNLLFFRFFGQILGSFDAFRMFIQVISNTIFLGIFGACGFSIFQSAVGRYAEIPALSDVVYTQVR
ncbi:Tic20 family protein [Candidatus Cyanaurora vandensis]|uniref:Tic20 family protein n=1 Tax=Candidatus Cyanaurora vandensis TaxID=2714958 RepID=UPI00257F0E09|nr:Tic20 family protein [Candidatus Cyanaurora vandensis]